MQKNALFIAGCAILALVGSVAVGAPHVPPSIWASLIPKEARARTLTAAAAPAGTGIDGESLSGIPETDALDMHVAAGRAITEVLFIAKLTAGTTTEIDIACTESIDGTTYAPAGHCTDAADATCVAQNLSFGVANNISFVVKTRAPWLKCTFDDPNQGNGTIVVKASLTSR